MSETDGLEPPWTAPGALAPSTSSKQLVERLRSRGGFTALSHHPAQVRNCGWDSCLLDRARDARLVERSTAAAAEARFFVFFTLDGRSAVPQLLPVGSRTLASGESSAGPSGLW